MHVPTVCYGRILNYLPILRRDGVVALLVKLVHEYTGMYSLTQDCKISLELIAL